MTPCQLVDKKIVILSHYATTGACEELRDWLRKLGVRELVYIAFPFGPCRDRFIRVDHFRNGERAGSRRSLFRLKMAEPFAYAKDFLYALLYVGRFAGGAEALVAGDNLLALAGALMRRVAGIRRVVYYMIDYTPIRYANRFLNGLYYRVDRAAACRADAVWPLNPRIIQGRFEAGRLKEGAVRWYAVPYGSHPVEGVAASAGDRRQVVYLGDVVSSKGAELFVPLALELKSRVSDFRLVVIGGGKGLPALREAVNRAGLAEHFEICGFVEEMQAVVARLTEAGVALAPYHPGDANSFSFYADPGKIKVYLGCGLPVVLTDVPPIARELEREGAGKIVRYEAADIAAAVAAILGGEGYARYRENARRLGARYAWDNVFADAFDKLDAPDGAGKGVTP